MWCLVSQPNAVTLEVRLDLKATGQDCLEKILRQLDIIEDDYFGLQYCSGRGDDLWLNLRNQIQRQVKGPSPYRFALRVKFWVPPHLLLQTSTRHLFYLHTRLEMNEKRLKIPATSIPKIAALIYQAEKGDANDTSFHYNLYTALIEPMIKDEKVTEDMLIQTAQEHTNLKGMESCTAEYWVLKEVCNLESFGEEYFHVRNNNGSNLLFGVGPHGVSVQSLHENEDIEKISIPFTAIQNATYKGKNFFLFSCNNNQDTDAHEFKLDSHPLTIGLYRAITEKHAFYSCETVRSAVTTQFVRDLKGTIASLFNENTHMGKRYLFDIKRTCREVYDNARRVLYQSQGGLKTPPHKSATICDIDGHSNNCQNQECKDMKEYIQSIQDGMICHICMDKEINAVFCECGHVVSCIECADRCECCPVCRAEVTRTQVLYFSLAFKNFKCFAFGSPRKESVTNSVDDEASDYCISLRDSDSESDL